MSDYFGNNGSEEQEQSNGEYSYSRNEINQGESYYQWTPYEDKTRPKKVKKTGGFGAKLAKTAAVALVFGLVAGITFQAVVVVSGKFLGTSTQTSSVEEVKPVEATLNTANNTAVATGTTTASITTDVSEIAVNVMPAIVQVTNVGIETYRSFFGSYQYETTSCGSGIIISQDNDNIYIATNYHVVSGAETLTITFCDDSAVEGEIKGTDSSCDLAVIAVAINDIPDTALADIKVATIGDSESTVVGEGCVVIGNALGYGQSVTTGIISAKDRVVEIQDDSGNVITNSLIQTDAAVNPGNSGGAILNMRGEVIGIVSAKLQDTKVEGMGYAIPISYASSIIEQMINYDVVSELDASYLGIAGVDLGADRAAEHNIPTTGVYVSQVVPMTGAEAAGIEAGDVITSFNGRKVTSMSTIQNILQYIPAGTTVEIVVAKANNNYEEVTYDVTLTSKNSQIN